MAEGGAPRKDTKEQGFHVKDMDGNTPLHVAARAGYSDVIRDLLTLNKDLLEERNVSGETALYLAVASGNKEAVKCLLDAGADPNIVTNDGFTVMRAAVSSGCTEMITIISEASAAFRPEKTMQVKEHAETEMKLPSGNDAKEDSSTASESGVHERKRKPGEGGINSNICGKDTTFDRKLHTQPPTSEKRKRAKWEEIYKLADSIGSSSDSDDEKFSEKSFRERVKEEFRSDFYKEKTFNLRKLANETRHLRQKLNSLKSFSKFDLEEKDEDGFTLLHKAAMFGAEGCVAKILKCSVNVNVKSSNGQTPFHVCMSSGSEPIMNDLLKAGADYKLQDNFGRTALHLAANWKNLEAVKKLLALGLDPNHKSHSGQTPLHAASMVHKNRSVLVELLKHGADKSIKNNMGATPAEYAAQTNDEEMIRAFIT